jgi:hypothetical protein
VDLDILEERHVNGAGKGHEAGVRRVGVQGIVEVEARGGVYRESGSRRVVERAGSMQPDPARQAQARLDAGKAVGSGDQVAVGLEAERPRDRVLEHPCHLDVGSEHQRGPRVAARLGHELGGARLERSAPVVERMHDVVGVGQREFAEVAVAA